MNSLIIEKLEKSYNEKEHYSFEEYLAWEQDLIQENFSFLFIHRFFIMNILSRRYFSCSFHKKDTRIRIAKRMFQEMNISAAKKALKI